ncbi:MAG: S8 family serine peptidase [Marinovum algicola]|uniref:S8 family serine peptidase n=1 Tax=Marinovum algicola TaxID=42444 RepID=UPI0032ECBD6C
MVASTNPLYTQQWHFNLIGDIEAIWADYTGSGVTVGVYDDGTEAAHEDLDGNYDSTLHYMGLGADDGQPNSAADGHGTSVAGIIAAENNSLGGVGVAFNVTIAGVDLLNDVFAQGNDVNNDALRFMETFDITNNSWGYTPTYEQFLNLSDPGSVAGQEGAAFAHAAENGRGGLGTIILKAAGNDTLNAQGEGHNSLHQVITVAAAGQSGEIANYSNWGANLLITAPAASVTTDLEGSGGYSPDNYTDTFGGTSAATPVVSGVVALMLQANPDLGWRDVQNILAISAAHTGSAYGGSGSGSEVGDWLANGAGNWNGGGMSFHHSYGFGMVDAFAAVRMAEVWDLLYADAATSANLEVLTASYSGAPVAITDNSTASVTLSVTEGVIIEHIYVTIEGSHTYMGDLTIQLESPTGEIFDLFLNELGNNDLNGTWVFGVSGALGVSSVGDWTIHITDNANFDEGSLTGVELEFRGADATTDTVHHITGDFTDYLAQEAGRGTIEDSDGGTDWLNMAALTDAIAVTLASGAAITVGGTQWASIGSGLIENIATGDGNDTVTGLGDDNHIVTGRGNDRIDAGAGDDTIDAAQDDDLVLAGAGNDSVDAGGGADTVDGGAGNDSIFGDWGADSLTGGAGNDTLIGDSAFDTLEGGDGNDSLVGGTGADRLDGDGDNDTLLSNTGVDTVFGGAGDDWISSGNGADIIDGGEGDDFAIGRTGTDSINGGAGNDSLYGSAGIDTITGGTGDEYVSAGSAWDLVFGNSGNDTLEGNFGSDFVSGGEGNDSILGGTGDDTLAGGDGSDTILGNQGRDVIDGGTGNDLLRGGTLADEFHFGVNGGTDTIQDFENFQDALHLDASLVGGRTDGQDIVDTYATVVGSDTVFTLDDGTTIILEGETDLTLLYDNVFVV